MALPRISVVLTMKVFPIESSSYVDLSLLRMTKYVPVKYASLMRIVTRAMSQSFGRSSRAARMREPTGIPNMRDYLGKAESASCNGETREWGEVRELK